MLMSIYIFVDTDNRPKPKRLIKQRQSLADKQPGTTIFPMSRVKRIIKVDKDVETMSSEATFMIAVATVSPESSLAHLGGYTSCTTYTYTHSFHLGSQS